MIVLLSLGAIMMAASSFVPIGSLSLRPHAAGFLKQFGTCGKKSPWAPNRRKSLQAASESADPSAVRLALGSILDRAQRTLTYTTTSAMGYEGSDLPIRQNTLDLAGQVLQNVTKRVQSTRECSTDSSGPSTVNRPKETPTPTPAMDVVPRPTNLGIHYGKNPTISSTALAHSLWSYVLRPGIDSAIDATAGNGGDSVALAKMLFANITDPGRSELISIDIQEQACQNTLQQILECRDINGERLLADQSIRIIQVSHAPLPLPRDPSSVGLIVYNLGFLPNSGETKKRMVLTSTDTTVASLADAALVVRVGGLLCVTTYPRTNAEEDVAVRAFLEGLALFTSVTRDWREYIQSLDLRQARRPSSEGAMEENEDDDDNNDNRRQHQENELRERLLITLNHVREEGDPAQTWRVHEHRKLGWTDAPILLTATRIK